jgi:hypothetical protein
LPVDVKVVAGPEFERTRAELLKQAKLFQRRVASATRRAVDRTYRPAVVSMAPSLMPDRYAGLLTRDLKVSTSVRFSGSAPGVTVSVSAPTGGPQGRDVSSLERGRLSHPLFGDKSHWYRQSVTRGFASKPVQAIRPKIVAEIDQELDKVSRDVKGA